MGARIVAWRAALARWIAGGRRAAGDRDDVVAGIQLQGFPAPLPVPSGWHALPGMCMELRDSGFSIELRASTTQFTYVLIGPEHQQLAFGGDLPGLKALGERYAREREEFEFKGVLR